MILVHAAQQVSSLEASRTIIRVVVDRHTLARRLWRGCAEDGTDFGFELESPLRHGDCIHLEAGKLYRIEQQTEALLEVPLDLTPCAAAVVGWTIGNMHCPVEVQEERLLAADDKGLRQALERAGIHYHQIEGVFTAGARTSSAGHSHHHGHSHEHGHSHGHHHG